MAGLLFNRKAELIVGPKFAGSNRLIEPPLAKIFRTRIKFKVDKNDGSDSNKAKVSIYNLNEDSRNFIEQENSAAILRVGYGNDLSILFFGDLTKNGINNKRVGPDIITTIDLDDAGNVLQTANIQIGLAAGATNIQVLNLAIEKLRLSAGPIIGLKTIVYKNGFTFSGMVSVLLNQLTKQMGLLWSVNDGEISILPPKITEPGQIISLGPKTGLIGSPTKTQENFKFQSLIIPSIRPNKKVFIKSRIALGELGATIKVTKAEYEGDTHEGNWLTKYEGLIL